MTEDNQSHIELSLKIKSEEFSLNSAAPMYLFDQDETVRCPMSGKPLRLKDLIPVTFTLAKDGDKRALIAKDVNTPFLFYPF